ncbi:MAG: hypothetical protein GEU71_13445 [Actinobacteria bacterium]|nr:hypothetical protein [Actinomycetota bacterium]
MADRFRRFFKRSGGTPELGALTRFAQERKGVEGFIEPRTATQPTTLLLVDREGDHARAPVREPRDAVRFCEKLGIPVYDAAIIGYPKRMKEFNARSEGKGTQNDAAFDQAFEEIQRRFKEDPGSTSKG